MSSGAGRYGSAPMATYLDSILVRHRAEAAADSRSTSDLLDEARLRAPTRGFRRALVQGERLAVISEVKRRSPSKGDLFADLDPARLAHDYQVSGAACLSVLTDGESFGGSPEDLAAARAAVSLPVLRKDFTVSARDVCDARLMGADAVLLIAAALDDEHLGWYHDLAEGIGLDVLVEVHDGAELERAAKVGATLIGVNQRDLVTFAVDRDRAASLRPRMPEGAVTVAESGVGGPEDAAALRAAGYDAILVGESVVTAGDHEAAVRALVTA